MSRPCKLRTVALASAPRVFMPSGVPMVELREVVVTLDALEALRLADAEGLEHTAAAALMNVSRPTFSRLIAAARTAVATALVEGWAIRIEGGPWRTEETAGCGCGERHRRRGHCRRLATRVAESADAETALTPKQGAPV